MAETKRVVIVGGGFAGLNAAKKLSRSHDVSVTLIDRRNHHLFQPLLYQVAMAGLSPADIAAPIRSILSHCRNVRVLQGAVTGVELNQSLVQTDFGDVPYDYLLLACGAGHSYFGHAEWEEHAPGLKTIEQATEIRRRVLTAFEQAERNPNPSEQKRLLTFVVIGGGPTGVELAGAIGEMSRYTLAKDFRSIDATLARVLLIEAGPRILPTFSDQLAHRAMRDLESLGVQVWTSSRVTKVDEYGVEVGDERVRAATVLWAAGVEASPLGHDIGVETDRQGGSWSRRTFHSPIIPTSSWPEIRHIAPVPTRDRSPALHRSRSSRDDLSQRPSSATLLASHDRRSIMSTREAWPRSAAVVRSPKRNA
ncbi:MAG: NAD(P)/FAD-dependent oxidoreductase [Planctomycetaceae bacterium]